MTGDKGGVCAIMVLRWQQGVIPKKRVFWEVFERASDEPLIFFGLNAASAVDEVAAWPKEVKNVEQDFFL